MDYFLNRKEIKCISETQGELHFYLLRLTTLLQGESTEKVEPALGTVSGNEPDQGKGSPLVDATPHFRAHLEEIDSPTFPHTPQGLELLLDMAVSKQPAVVVAPSEENYLVCVTFLP